MIFNQKYFLVFLILLVVETVIAVFVHDRFIRPYIGDVLVVILVYVFVRSFIKTTVHKAAIGVFIFAVLVEVLQYLDLVTFLHLKKNSIAYVVAGHYFSWGDIGCYVAGVFIILAAEKKLFQSS